MAVDGAISGTDLAAVAKWLRAEHPEILKEMRKGLRATAKPILDAERKAVKELTFSTTVDRRVFGVKVGSTTKIGSGAGGGSGAKARADARGTASLAVAASTGRRLVSAKTVARNRRTSGLRETIARGMRVTYSDRGKEAKVAVKTTSSSMPPGQKNLPRLVNYGRWRHPVFAKPGLTRRQWTWVYQHPSRVGWWWQTAEAEIPAAITSVTPTMAEIVKLLADKGQAVAKDIPLQ